MKKQHHITLFQEEVNSLLNFNEICVYQDEEREILLKIPYNQENVLTRDILDRYDNEEYWNKEILGEKENE